MKRTLLMLGLVVLAWVSSTAPVGSRTQWLAENSGGIVINPTWVPPGGTQTPPPVRPG